MTAVAGGASAPAAMAADDCPNAAVRAQQGVQHLPNCMAYEKITPDNKNGAPIGAEFLVSDDGNEAWVYAGSPIVDGASGVANELLASRGADGWSLKPLIDTPAYTSRRNGFSNDYPGVWGYEGMRRILFKTMAPLDPGDVGGGEGMTSNDLYVREEDGTLRWLTPPEGFTYAPHDPAGSLDLFRSTPDFSTILFGGTRIMNRSIDATQREHIWIRREGKPYELIDYMPDGSVSTQTTSAGLSDALRMFGPSTQVTQDLSTVVWATRVRVGRNNIDHYYARVAIGTPQARTIAISESADGSSSCSTTEGFHGMTLDGRYVRFLCRAQLTDDAPTTGGMYVKDLRTGDVLYDDPKVDRGPMTTDSTPTSWTRPDGTYRLESRTGQGLWSVHLPSGEEKCVTCFDGRIVQPGVAGYTGGYGFLNVGGLGPSTSNFVTPEGDVFFVSSEQLVPEDTNDLLDLYMSVDGKVYLLSGGDATRRIQMGGVSLDGNTATFVTTSSLLAEDRDGGNPDVYVVRRNGGFLRSEPAAECASNCQGPAVPVGPLLAPLSLSFPPSGDVVDEDADPVSVSGSRSVRGTSLKVKVRTPGAGRVTVSGNGLRSATKSVKSATSASVTVRLSARSKRLLRKRSSVKIKATVRFVPTGGKSQTKRVNLTFRKAKKATKKKGSSRGAAAASTGKAAR